MTNHCIIREHSTTPLSALLQNERLATTMKRHHTPIGGKRFHRRALISCSGCLSLGKACSYNEEHGHMLQTVVCFFRCGSEMRG